MNLLSSNVWVTLLVTSGFYLQQTCANHNSNGTGSGTKIPCPDSTEADKLFAGRELHINKKLKEDLDFIQTQVANTVSMKLYENVKNKHNLINPDCYSYQFVAPLCDTNVTNYTVFMEQIYMPLAKCGDRFCSDVKACMREKNLCPQDSDNLEILDGYTRCVKVQYDIKYENKTIPDNYQDVCMCAFCDNRKKGAIFYLVFENTEARPGVYFYQRLDSNPYTWDSSALKPHYKLNIPNTQNSSQDVNLDYYAFFDKKKYAELFELNNSSHSTCQSGAIYLVLLPDYTPPPPTQHSGKHQQ